MIDTNSLWPETKPGVPADPHGWFSPLHEEFVLEYFKDHDVKTIVELGSWLGQSTRFFLDHNPKVEVYAVDTWLGGPDHQAPHGACHEKLPTLYETFLVNCWEYKNRLYPLKMTTIDGLKAVYDSGINPDMIYIDADHSYEAVKQDISCALDLFPYAHIFGDDWNWGRDRPVKRAVQETAAAYGKEIGIFGDWLWYFK